MRRYSIYIGVAALTFAGGVIFASLRLINHHMLLEHRYAQVIAEPAVKRPDFAEAFQDFVYVGSSSTGADDPGHIHSFTETVPRPQRFDVGVRYFFQLPNHENEAFDLDYFFVILRDRLQAQGISTSFVFLPNGGLLVSGLSTVMDYRYYMEHPIAQVNFRGAGCEGKVVSVLHESNSKGKQSKAKQYLHDYILVVEKCGN
jgi:hypothetical protein